MTQAPESRLPDESTAPVGGTDPGGEPVSTASSGGGGSAGGDASGSGSEGGAATSRSRPGFLRWLPWEKITIWGVFLLGIYALRHFFFVIFMTFLVAYIMRGVIVRVTFLVTGRRHAPFLERILAIVCFALLIYGSYFVGQLLFPHIQRQYHVLEARVKAFDFQVEVNNLGARTVGAYFFEETYGDVDDPRYEKAFEEFTTGNETRLPRQKQIFQAIDTEIEALVESMTVVRNWVDDEVKAAESEPEAFENWFLAEQAPKLLAKERESEPAIYEQRVKRYDLMARDVLEIGSDEFAAHVADPTYIEKREQWFRGQVLTDVEEDPGRLAEARKKWHEALEADAQERARTSPEILELSAERRREVYEKKRAENPERFRWDFDTYVRLKAAFDESNQKDDEAIFYAVLDLGAEAAEDEEKRLEELHKNFVLEKQSKAWEDWWKGETGTKVREITSRYLESTGASFAVWVRDSIVYLLTLPIQLSLSLLLAFFITFDIPKLRRGVGKIRRSRVANIYEEIAPGLISFGHLIGRAFQAQGVIAVFNTLLTFLAIRILGIDNEVFLCAIVFICSFIPVLGVVLSSVPIAVMAITQVDGSLLLAVKITAAIIVIHFIETSVLNPKILGDMLHLHPVGVLTVLAVGEHFFGVWGLLLGVPVAVYIIRFVILNEGIPGLIPAHGAASRVPARPASPPRERVETVATPKREGDDEGEAVGSGGAGRRASP